MQKFPAHRVRPFFVLLLALGLSVLPIASSALDLLASNTQQLRNAIIDINEVGGGEVHTITLTADITLTDVLTPIKANIEFDGADFTVSGDDQFQIFFVHTGEVTFSDMTLTNGASVGGDGGGRGGGGLGAGGALFVDETAIVSLSNVLFVDNTAQGGSGGTNLGLNVGGGGGGFHGDGGGIAGTEGGGGGGYNGDGGDGNGGGGGMEGHGEDGLDGGNGGGELIDGGGGLGAVELLTTVGENGGPFEGGGSGVTGGIGGIFGGGGAGATPGAGGDFGGGGGAINLDAGVSGRPGGKGGFGGGGGGSSDGSSSEGGFGGGAGAGSGIGGAGSSLGGAIFVRTGGKLTVDVTSNGNITSGNSVNAANAGSGSPEIEGDDFYVMNGVDLDIAVGPGATATITGSIAGEGGLLVSGNGTLRLTGTNEYTGGTDIGTIGATLIGTTDSLQGDIAVTTDAFLEFEQNTSGTYAGVLSGDGTLTKSGTGTVTLSGESTHQGPTIIDDGTLRVSTASLTGIGTTTINGVATLEFDQDTDGTFPGVIEGDGGGTGLLVKSGTGTVSFSGDNALFDDPTTIAAGGLKLLSSAALGGAITVENGGLFGGAGTATENVSVFGTLTPGSGTDFETLSIGGDLTMDPGATLRIAVEPGGQSSAVDVTGTATVNGALELMLGGGDYAADPSFDIVNAGGLAGAGLTVTNSFCRLVATTMNVGSTLTLLISVSDAGFEDCADTGNQTAIAAALDLNDGDAALAPILNALDGLNTEQIPAALDQLGGEGLGGFTTARLAAGSQLMNSLSHRMRDPGSAAPEASEYPLSFSGFDKFDGGTLTPGLGNATSLFSGAGFRSRRAGFEEDKQSPFTFVSMRGESGLGGWIDGFAVFAENSGGNNAHDTDFNLYGTSGGVDFAFGKGFVAGAALGYTRTKLAVSDLGTFGTGDTVQPAVYGSYANDFFYVGGVARYAYSALETSRRVALGELYEKPEGSWDGHEYSGYLEAGLAAVPLRSWKLQPTASFLYTHLTQDGFTEKKATDTALTVDSAETTSMVTSLGTRFYKHITMGEDADVIPELRIRWAHEFGDTNRDVDAEFASVGSTSAFRIKGADPGADAAIVGVGWTVLGDKGSTLGLNYDATVNADYISHAVTVQLMLLF